LKIYVYNAGSSNFSGIAAVSAITLEIAASADLIVDGAVTTDKLYAGAVTAGKISVTNLAAINADLGSVTAGTFTGGLTRTAATGKRIQLTTTSLASILADDSVPFELTNDGELYIAKITDVGEGRMTLELNSAEVFWDFTVKVDNSAVFSVDNDYVSAYGHVNLSSGHTYCINSVQVVGPQGSAITAPSGGGTVDAEARTAIGAIISRLAAHGLIAT